MQKELDRCPLENKRAQRTFQRLGGVKISEMKIDDDDKNQKEVKKIENIDITKNNKWLGERGD